MTVEISYFSSFSKSRLPVAADPGVQGVTPRAPESVSITSSPTASGVTGDGTEVVSLIGTEPFRYEYTQAGGTSAAATSNYVAAGERMWLAARPGYKFSLRTP